MTDTRYPFAAIVGQEQVKKALLYNLIEPRIGGVLLCGEKGTAKSTIVRGLASLTAQKVVDLPLNITEDMLVGAIDFEKAVHDGIRTFSGGVLERADGNILRIRKQNRRIKLYSLRALRRICSEADIGGIADKIGCVESFFKL